MVKESCGAARSTRKAQQLQDPEATRRAGCGDGNRKRRSSHGDSTCSDDLELSPGRAAYQPQPSQALLSCAAATSSRETRSSAFSDGQLLEMAEKMVTRADERLGSQEEMRVLDSTAAPGDAEEAAQDAAARGGGSPPEVVAPTQGSSIEELEEMMAKALEARAGRSSPSPPSTPPLGDAGEAAQDAAAKGGGSLPEVVAPTQGSSSEELEEIVVKALEARARRSSPSPPSLPPQMLGRLLLPCHLGGGGPAFLWWQSIDARLRRWVTRRVGKYNIQKLALKVIYGAIDNVVKDLGRANIEISPKEALDELWDLLPCWVQDPEEGGSRGIRDCGWKAWQQKSHYTPAHLISKDY